MFVDASAIVAILLREADGPALAARMGETDRLYSSSIALYEAVLGIARVLRVQVEAARAEVDNFVAEAGIEIIPITAEMGGAAIDAFTRYGRGQHAAQLNMGDCFAYACARSLGVALLYKGDDFAQTDLATG
jgi:ribonuclease VapC